MSRERELIILEALAKHFEELADMTKKVGNLERAKAYKICANDVKEALTGSYGWQLDLQEKLRSN